MSEYQFVALLLAAIGPALALARAVGAPESLVLFGLGLLSALVPGLPEVAVDPALVLNLFLPPLLYASTVRVTWHLLRFTLLPGALVGALMVPATMLVVAPAARLVLPGLSWTGALLIGALAALFDTRLFHEARGRPHVSRAVADALKARELAGRLVVVATVALLVETARQGQVSALEIAEHYGLDIPAGLLVGIAIGGAVAFARSRIDPAPVEIAVSLATPYGAALAAGALGLSVVGAVTAAALTVSAVRIDRRTGAPISSAETRVSAAAFWEEVSLMVSSALFFLAGRALPQALGTLGGWPLPRVLAAAGVVLALVLLVQVALGAASALLPPVRDALGGRSRFAAAGVMAWSSTRSVIGLVLALSVPAALPDGRPFPERDLVLVVAALTIVASVLVQGLTLRPVVARAGLAEEDETEAERDLARRAIEAAMAAPGDEAADGFDAARKALVRLRERDRIGDEVLVAMLRETDLLARAAEGDALPGGGPPNP